MMVPIVAQALPTTELLGKHGPVVPLKNAAMLTQSKWGYRYYAGQQDSRLTVRMVDRKLLYVDAGTKELRKIPKTCERKSVKRGVAALCKVPARWHGGKAMFLEIWPRLGDDFVDTSALPARFRSWVLADAGRDVVRTGAGNDFVNGAQDADRVSGGSGNDWLRTGLGNDEIYGGAGNDKLVGVDGSDRIHAGAGSDFVGCGNGRDRAMVDRADRSWKCESVARY